MKIKRFKTYLREGRYPLWVRFTVGGLVLKVKNLEMQINSTSDTEEQNKLISKQNVLLLAYYALKTLSQTLYDG